MFSTSSRSFLSLLNKLMKPTSMSTNTNMITANQLLQVSSGCRCKSSSSIETLSAIACSRPPNKTILLRSFAILITRPLWRCFSSSSWASCSPTRLPSADLMLHQNISNFNLIWLKAFVPMSEMFRKVLTWITSISLVATGSWHHNNLPLTCLNLPKPFFWAIWRVDELSKRQAWWTSSFTRNIKVFLMKIPSQAPDTKAWSSLSEELKETTFWPLELANTISPLTAWTPADVERRCPLLPLQSDICERFQKPFSIRADHNTLTTNRIRKVPVLILRLFQVANQSLHLGHTRSCGVWHASG